MDTIFYDIRQEVEIVTDNEFDDDEAFFAMVNRTIRTINLNLSLNISLVKRSAIEEFLLEDDDNYYSKYTNLPVEGLECLISGLETQLLKIEQEDDRGAALTAFEAAMQKFDLWLKLDAFYTDGTQDKDKDLIRYPYRTNVTLTKTGKGDKAVWIASQNNYSSRTMAIEIDWEE